MRLKTVVQSNPYASIAAWWGEDLSESLIARILKAPPTHLERFRMAAEDAAIIDGVPALPSGELRPVLKYSTADSYRGRGGFRYLRSALLMLLYVDQVGIQDPTPAIEADNCGSILQALLLLKPLHEAGIVTFLRVPDRYHHPSHSHAFMTAGNAYLRSMSDDDPICKETRRLGALERPYDFGTLAFMCASSVGEGLQLVADAPHALNLFAGSAEEAVYLSLAIRTAGAAASDLRTARLTALSTIEIPTLRASAVPMVRLQSDEFHAWREAIGVALARVTTISDDDEAWQSEARAIFQDAIAPIRARLLKSVKKSPALATARSGLASLTYSGLGALAGGAVGGTPATALVGAASAKGVEFGVSYLRALRAQRADRAMLDLALSFYEPGP